MSEFEYKAFEAKFGGLPPEDFKRFLENKLKVLFVVKNGTLGTIMKKATESSVRKVCIRPKISDPYELDRRCSRSIAWYNIILDRTAFKRTKERFPTTMSPAKLEAETSGKRGTQKHSKTLNKDYHLEQDDIFTLLSRFLNKLQQPDFQVAKEDTCVAQLDFQVPKEDTSEAQPDFQAPKEDTSVAQPDFQVPKEDTSVAQPDFQVPKEDTSEAQPDFQVPKEDTSEAQPDFQVPKEDTSEAQPYFQVPKEGTSEAQPYFQVPKEDTSEAQPDFQVPKEDTSEAQPDFQAPKEHTSEALCIKIDCYTSAILNFCALFIDDPRMYPDFEAIALLSLITYKCLVIVLERNIVDHEKLNDLMKEKGWKNWKDHLIVLMSYAALLVSLKMVAKLCTRKYRKINNSLKEIKAFYGLTDGNLGDIIFLLE